MHAVASAEPSAEATAHGVVTARPGRRSRPEHALGSCSNTQTRPRVRLPITKITTNLRSQTLTSRAACRAKNVDTQVAPSVTQVPTKTIISQRDALDRRALRFSLSLSLWVFSSMFREFVDPFLMPVSSFLFRNAEADSGFGQAEQRSSPRQISALTLLRVCTYLRRARGFAVRACKSPHYPSGCPGMFSIPRSTRTG